MTYSPHHDHHGATTSGAHDPSAGSAQNMIGLLDLDAEVLADYWSAALDWVRSTVGRDDLARVLDLGAGTGVGAIGLAERFPAAQVVAVDIATDSLERLRVKAAEAGVASRVRALEVDIDPGWPDLGELDLTWASMSMHHFADPDRVLRDVRAATRAGGVIAVAEFSEPLRFLPEDLGVGQPGFEARIAGILSHAHTETMPTLGSQWAPRLAAAGWDVVAERDFAIDLDPPRHDQATAYAREWFVRLSHGLADRLEAADRVTLAALVADGSEGSLVERISLHIRGVRTVTVGRSEGCRGGTDPQRRGIQLRRRHVG